MNKILLRAGNPVLQILKYKEGKNDRDLVTVNLPRQFADFLKNL